MTTTVSSPPRRVFGAGEISLDESEVSPPQGFLRGLLARLGIARRQGVRLSDGDATTSERPPIPSALQHAGEPYTTPLPTLSIVVLSITMLGEFLSANVSVPFLLFMVKGFGGYADEADAAFWTGILVSFFFLTQFMTSLLWATIAAKHGQRAVLFVTLLGSAVTCLIFGTCTSLRQAIVVRLLQGIFAGAVGVARGTVTTITDATNEGRAYAILGFSWGFGGVAGAVIGGSLESPASKWPNVFAKHTIFVKYPYLLPCAVAASITFSGSILSLFLGRDGGPRQGTLRLPEQKDENMATILEEPSPHSPIPEEIDTKGGFLASLRRKFSRGFSGCFPQGGYDSSVVSSPVAMSPPVPRPVMISERARTASRTSRANGSAYGYSGSYRDRLASNATASRWSFASRRRRGSNLEVFSTSQDSDLNFAQRLVLASENAVTNIADLWVAAALNVDNENPFESDTELDDPDASALVNSPRSPSPPEQQPSSSAYQPGSLPSDPSFESSPFSIRTGSPTTPPLYRTSSFRNRPTDGYNGRPRRSSTNSTVPIPTIFSHPGVRSPPAIVDVEHLLGSDNDSSLLPLSENVSQLQQPALEKSPPLMSQIPIMIIVQYAILALHATTHDQIFMSYLVSKYDAGGLNLNAGHFAQLIALMCLAQTCYQFYLYPNMGPPRGRFSHLAMFRLGSFLFIPSYLSVTLYRAFANARDDGKTILMIALTLSTAIRYCAITFAYTAICILLNYMTPPASVGFANGIAQSIVSLARCFGPALGGYLWSTSVQDNPSGYSLGFIICAVAAAVAVVSSYLIR